MGRAWAEGRALGRGCVGEVCWLQPSGLSFSLIMLQCLCWTSRVAPGNDFSSLKGRRARLSTSRLEVLYMGHVVQSRRQAGGEGRVRLVLPIPD